MRVALPSICLHGAFFLTCVPNHYRCRLQERNREHTRKKKNRPCIGVLVTAQKLGKQAPIDNGRILAL